MKFRRFVVGFSLVVLPCGLFMVCRLANGQAVEQPSPTSPWLKRKGRVLLGSLGGAGAISLSPDGQWLLAVGSVSQDGTAFHTVAALWNTSTGKGGDLLDPEAILYWTHDNRLVGLSYSKPVVTLFSPQRPDARQRLSWQGEVDEPQDVKVSPDGIQLWLLTDHQFFRFQIKDRQLLQRLRWGDKHTKRSTGSGTEASLSPSGLEILSQEKFVTFYSTQNGRRLRRLPFLKKSAHSASFDAAGNVDEVMTDVLTDERVSQGDLASTVVTRRASDGRVLSKRQDVNRGDHGGPYTQEDATFIYTLDGDQIWKTPK